MHKEKEAKNREERNVRNKDVCNGKEECFGLTHKNNGLSKERTEQSEIQQSKPSKLKNNNKRSKESKRGR